MIGAALGAGTAIFGGIQQQQTAEKALSDAKKVGAKSSRFQQAESAKVGAEAEFAREQKRAAEETRLIVTSQLGRAGTYGPSPGGSDFGLGTPAGLSGLTTGPGTFSGGLWGDEETKGGTIVGGKYDKKTGARKGSVDWGISGQALDPEAMAAGIMGTSQFSTVSGMVAEANQLQNRQGPLWEELNNAIVGSVYEGAAANQRQQMEEISRGMARGGNARTQGLALAKKFKVQNDINQQRSSQLWQSRMALDQWVGQKVQQNLAFAGAWTDNQAGIRDSYTAAMTDLRTFWSQTMPAAAMGANASTTAATQSAMGNAYDSILSAQGTKWNAISGAVEGLGGVAMMGVGGLMMAGGGAPNSSSLSTLQSPQADYSGSR